MIDISEKAKTLYKTDRYPLHTGPIEKELFIEVIDSGTVITESNIETESFVLEESICSETDITFGSCEASMVSFAVCNINEELNDKKIKIWQEIEGEPVPFGTYRIKTVTKRDADPRWKDITAYDRMTEVDADVTSWYGKFWENRKTANLREFRLSFFQHMEFDTVDQELPNDDMEITKTIDPEYVKGRYIAQQIGEVNACFGHFTRENKFKYISIGAMGLYPSETLYPAEDLFPSEPTEMLAGDSAIYFASESHYEDYYVQAIDSIQIKEPDGSGGIIVGDTQNNPYIIQGNFLLYDKSDSELREIANNLLILVKNKTYMPNTTKMIGLPYLEAGDSVAIIMDQDAVESFIFKRRLSGIQSLLDEITATGNERRQNDTDDSTQLVQLKEKVETVIEVTEEKMEDLTEEFEGGLEDLEEDVGDVESDTEELDEEVESNRVSISVTADSITSTVAGSVYEWDDREYEISYYSYGAPSNAYPPISPSLVGKYYLDQSTNTVYRCAQKNGEIWWGYPKDYKALGEKYSIYKRGDSAAVNAFPPTSVNKIGKYYSDDTTGDIYQCQEIGKDSVAWMKVDKKPKKYKISYSGNGAPISEYPQLDPGTVGRYYLNETTNLLYKCVKRSGGLKWAKPKDYAYNTITEAIAYRGDTEPSTANPPVSAAESGKYYLDQESGKVYRCNGSSWQFVKQLEKMSVTLRTSITQTMEAITLEAERAKDEENYLRSKLTITAEEIASEVARAQGAENVLSSKISQTSDKIAAEVTRATKAEGELSSRITITADSVNSKVSKGNVVSEINQTSDTISLTAGRLLITSGNFTLDSVGNIDASGGRIGVFNIDSNGYLSAGSSGTQIWANTIKTSYIYPTDGSDTMQVGSGSKETDIYGTTVRVGSSSATVRIPGTVYMSGVVDNTTSADANLHIGSAGNIKMSSGSSRRWKHAINDIFDPSIEPHKLLNVRPREFIYNYDYLSAADSRYGKKIPGFILEELMEDYPIAVEYDDYGNPVDWGAKFLVAPMLSLIQENYKNIFEMRSQIFAIQAMMHSLVNIESAGKENA